MINNNFKSNWQKILDYNSTIDLNGKAPPSKEKVRIPLTLFKVPTHILYTYVKFLYPKFVNDQQNILDLIISDSGDKILDLYLYETKKAGIHETIQKIPSNIIIFHERDLQNIEVLFNKLQLNIEGEKGLRISTLRIFKQEAIELINYHCRKIENISSYNFFFSFLTLVQNLLEQNLFYLYPEPNFLRFLRNSIDLLSGIRFTDIFSLVNDIFPELNIAFIINLRNKHVIVKANKIQQHPDNSKLDILLLTTDTLRIKQKNLSLKEYMNTTRKLLNVKYQYFLNLSDLAAILKDLFEIKFPLDKDKIELIFQKLIYGYRSIEKKWYESPKPKILSNLLRFLIRLIGFNLNLRKISHWSIPELVFYAILKNFGFNSKILVIITDNRKKRKTKLKGKDVLPNGFKSAILLDIKDKNLSKIIPVNKKEIFTTSNETLTLDSIRTRASERFGFVSAVFTIDKFLLKKLVQDFVFRLSRLNLISKLRTIKLLKKEEYFNLYPKIPLFQLILVKPTISLVKILLPIIIDKHEF